ncbi:flagellar biosynthesis protein FlhF [Siminovitchia terrae]|uniref:Flagellar biosynthesis protein FlhF n=1 Tax=Siminovitchia terrae TaxID=1914933 RepID=A0A429XBC8_SIMTE|nr:flagellar biosynthesis protein FlhF [Siminovitchia terrae]RST60748.1 flagellar biosynthesis protein FlhF [Siminovitchia terrae]GIN91360.1 flagellar biosynthesis protein FlhF [Siminovitchia terrae]GIN94705.1 flagellar biosynthesis protein FlhF [Siminovitchia terrae]
MGIKKIIAPSMPEAFQKVKEEVGEEAVILSSKVVWTGGVLGFFKKKKFEVVAVMDDDNKLPEIDPSPVLTETLDHIEQEPKDYEKSLLLELAELKEMVASSQKTTDPDLAVYPASIQKALETLLDQELDERHVAKIGERLLDSWRKAKKEPSEKEVIQEAKKILADQIDQLDFSPSGEKKFVALVGPTGVGKTTTLAKLAAHAALEEKKKVAFITLDTYRIAAIDQLKTYAGLLDIPVEVAYELEDFIKAVESFADYDQVFIDTAGRNYRDAEFVQSLHNILSMENDLKTFLVMGVTMKERDIMPIMDNFQHMSIDRLIFTKADETKVFGSMVNIMLKYNLPTAFVTTGQDVPDDIIIAAPELFVDFIFGDGSE